ncbi:MAG: DUF3300 domain-containing protein [Pseudomonadota bacterium]
MLRRRLTPNAFVSVLPTTAGALLLSTLWVQGTALAQDAQTEVAVEPPQQAAAPADSAGGEQGAGTGQASGTPASDNLLSEPELEQLVAPIALYSDPLLANVLIASTYPLEVVQAERWYEKNKDLQGDALQEALAQQDWDDSLKDLVAVPDVLDMMNKDLDWTQKLGDAVLAQQSDVMNAVQVLRARAQEAGTLESNPQQTVTVTQTVVQNDDGSASGEATAQTSAQPQEVIAIQPTNPEKVYVPYYDPNVVYGTWPYPTYQPYYYPPPPGYRFGSALATGLAWSAGFAIGNAIWGDNINWGRNDINVNVNRNISGNTINRNNVNVQKWEHNSEHRRGVQYNNNEVRNKFENQGNRNNIGQNAGDRRPGGGEGRPGAGNRPGNAGGRPTVSDLERDLKRPGGAEGRPGSGNLAERRPGGGEGRPGGDRPRVGGGDRPKAGGGDRPRAGGGDRPKVDAGARPGGGDRQANLKDRAPAKKPAANRPAAKKPAAKKPAARKPQSRPSGNAFKKSSGGGARKASSRGRASAGGRSISRGHGGGGRRAGGGRRR